MKRRFPLTALLVGMLLAGCITEDFAEGASSAADAAADTDTPDTSSVDAAPDASDASSSDTSDTSDTSVPDASCGNPCVEDQQALCGVTLENNCAEPVDCACPQGSICNDAQVCEPSATTAETGDRCLDGVDNDQDGLQDCRDTDCWLHADPTAPCWGEFHHAFVTAETTDGNIRATLSGASIQGARAAHIRCNQIARDRGLPATGWRAILSTSNSAARATIGLSKPVINFNGELVAQPHLFWTEEHQAPIMYDAVGNNQSESGTGVVHAWTGTLVDGATAEDTCDNWTKKVENGATLYGTAGRLDKDDAQWVDESDSSCSRQHHIYCIDGQSVLD